MNKLVQCSVCLCFMIQKWLFLVPVFQVLLGLRDTDDRIVASSLRALADMVPLLGGDVIMGAQRKTFFFHGMPKVTTVKPAKRGHHWGPAKVSSLDRCPLFRGTGWQTEFELYEKDTLSRETGSGAKLKMAACGFILCYSEDFRGSSSEESGSESE
jgi:hypothetical protein